MVELSIPIELDNQYANRVGEIDWVFLVEGFQIEDSTITVRKLWEDTGDYRPDSIFVELLENEKVSLALLHSRMKSQSNRMILLDHRILYTV